MEQIFTCPLDELPAGLWVRKDYFPDRWRAATLEEVTAYMTKRRGEKPTRVYTRSEGMI